MIRLVLKLNFSFYIHLGTQHKVHLPHRLLLTSGGLCYDIEQSSQPRYLSGKHKRSCHGRVYVPSARVPHALNHACHRETKRRCVELDPDGTSIPRQNCPTRYEHENHSRQELRKCSAPKMRCFNFQRHSPRMAPMPCVSPVKRKPLFGLIPTRQTPEGGFGKQPLSNAGRNQFWLDLDLFNFTVPPEFNLL